jgi:hypothetical protein
MPEAPHHSDGSHCRNRIKAKEEGTERRSHHHQVKDIPFKLEPRNEWSVCNHAEHNFEGEEHYYCRIDLIQHHDNALLLL